MIKLRDIVAGALTRFLPGAVLGIASVIALFNLRVDLPVRLLQYPLFLWAISLTGGFLVALLLLRRAFRHDLDIRGRVSVGGRQVVVMRSPRSMPSVIVDLASS